MTETRTDHRILAPVRALPRATRLLPLVALLLAAGCAGPVARFHARVPAEIDVGDIQRVAVADFDGLPQTGQLVAAKITEGIVRGGHFRMFERQKLQEVLDEREFSHSEHVDPATANRLKLLGVDALIFGVVDVYSVDDQTGVTKVETEIGTGEYETVREKGRDGKVRETRREIMKTVLIDRGHVIRKGTMGVTFRMANVNTGEIVAIRTETVHFSEKAWSDEAQKLPTKDAILDDMATRVVGQFLGQIQPQMVARAVRFEKNEAPGTETGIKYAQAGLWDKAESALRGVAMASPAVASARYNLGITYDARGKYAQAVAEIEEAIALEPKDSYIRALAEVRRHENDAATLRDQGARF
jgi:hypothetical protein